MKRWTFHDHSSEYFCARNFNKHGRYITIINIQGRRRSIVIILEMAFNTGWLDIAMKIERFINCTSHKRDINVHKNTEEGLLYSETVRRSKWPSREMNSATVKEETRTIYIYGGANSTHNELLSRSLVGSFSEDIPDIPSLSEIRRWVSSLESNHMQSTYMRWAIIDSCLSSHQRQS